MMLESISTINYNSLSNSNITSFDCLDNMYQRRKGASNPC